LASGKESRDEFVEDNDARPDASRDDDARPSRYQTFYQPLTAEEYDDARYQPEDVSFFSRSSEDRAEKARRAAHRVRRREPDVTNATPEPSVPPRPQPQVQSPAPLSIRFKRRPWPNPPHKKSRCWIGPYRHPWQRSRRNNRPPCRLKLILVL